MNNQVDNHGSTETPTNEEPKKGWMKKLLEGVWSWLLYKKKDEWLKEMRGHMCLMATFIATISFQIALNPPGGVRSFDNANPPIGDADVLSCNVQGDDSLLLCPGEAVLAVKYSDTYFDFLFSNTICFIASLSVCLSLVTGIRFNHRIPMWFLSMGMCIILTGLAHTYKEGVSMVTPNPVWVESNDLLTTLLDIWIKLFYFLAALLTLRIIIWGVHDLISSKKAKWQRLQKDIPLA